jgi:hypothetical protein
MFGTAKVQKGIKLSDQNVIRDLVHEAEVSDRSVAGQAEHWMKLGQAAEAILGSADVKLLKESLRTALQGAALEGVKEKILATLNQLAITSEREAVRTRILSGGVPVFQTDPTHPGRVLQINPDGTRVSGTIRDGAFVPAQAAGRRRKAS